MPGKEKKMEADVDGAITLDKHFCSLTGGHCLLESQTHLLRRLRKTPGETKERNPRLLPASRQHHDWKLLAL